MPNVGSDLINIRRFLKERLQRDRSTFYGHEAEKKNLHNLLLRSAEMGESNSLLIIGPRGAGKTTLINSVLADLVANKDFCQNTLIVHLNGNLHHDDRLALKSITIQMQLENAANGKVFGSFAENLAFLLACLKAGNKRSKSVIFILDEFDLFCSHHNQTLLYNLFDVSQSAQAPICVIGVTCRLDVIELLEKRVKSRFSHRQVFLLSNADDFDGYLKRFQELLLIPTENEIKRISEGVKALKIFDSTELMFCRNHYDPGKYKFHKKIVENWNKYITNLLSDMTVNQALHDLFDYDVSFAFMKCFIFRLVAHLHPEECTQVSRETIANLVETYEIDDKVELLCGLSVLEFCLVIAIKHHSEIYDRDPFNFEIIFGRFMKFAKVSTTMGCMERAVVLKAFEHLKNIEIILPISNSFSNAKVQKEFDMHRLALTYGQINQAVQKYQALPTEFTQWVQSSII